LKEHLIQVHQGRMEGEVLAGWLKQLQTEFIKRMTAIEAEAEEAQQENERNTGNDDGDLEMGDDSTEDSTEG